MVHSSFKEQHLNDELVTKESTSKETVFIANANEYFVNMVKTTVEESNHRMQGEKATEPSYAYPCIDISSWLDPHGNPKDRENVVDKVIKHAMEAGSFNICGHGITDDVFEHIGTQSKRFFELPLKVKHKYTTNDHKKGYLAVQSESAAAVLGEAEKETERRDLREVYTVEYPRESETNDSASPTFLRDPINDYLESMNNLDIVLHDIMTSALAKAKCIRIPDDLLNSAKDGATGCLRLSRYPKMDPKYDDATKLRWHSDWGTLTIIYSEYSGLEEIRGGEQVLVPVRRGELHVVIGEMIALWSNMHFKANIHRVSSQAMDDRISYSYFAAQGEKGDGSTVGIEPVCSEREKPRFGKTAAINHAEQYFQVYFNS